MKSDPLIEQLSSAMDEFFSAASPEDIRDLLAEANYDVLRKVDAPVCIYTQAYLPFVASDTHGLSSWMNTAPPSEPTIVSLERFEGSLVKHELALAA